MKKISTLLFIVLTIGLFAQENQAIDLSKSTIQWTGKKVTGTHTGYIDPLSIDLYFENGELMGGEIIMDMQSITCVDLKDESNDQLVAHLKSEDFFNVQAFPEANFEITNVEASDNENEYTITGLMVIKGIEREISFPARIDGEYITALIKVDRTHFDIRYGSARFFDSIGDKAIADIFTLSINLFIK